MSRSFRRCTKTHFLHYPTKYKESKMCWNVFAMRTHGLIRTASTNYSYNTVPNANKMRRGRFAAASSYFWNIFRQIMNNRFSQNNYCCCLLNHHHSQNKRRSCDNNSNKNQFNHPLQSTNEMVSFQSVALLQAEYSVTVRNKMCWLD